MKEFKSLNELLKFAIHEEEVAAMFYKTLAGKMDTPWMAEVFEQFSREEEGHKAKLEKIQSGELPPPPNDKVLDLKIGDYLVTAELNADMDYQQALIVAMKKEKAAFRMYTDLASVADNEDVRVISCLFNQRAIRQLQTKPCCHLAAGLYSFFIYHWESDLFCRSGRRPRITVCVNNLIAAGDRSYVEIYVLYLNIRNPMLSIISSIAPTVIAASATLNVAKCHWPI